MSLLVQFRLTILFVASACIAGTAFADGQDNRQYVVDPTTTAINGVTISSTEKEIVERLGKPKSVESSYSEAMGQPSKYLHYDGMKIYIIEGHIYNLSCTGKHCKTERGAKVGDSKSKVTKIYGAGYSFSSEESLSYPLRGSTDSYLVFIFKAGVVVDIEFWVNYT